MAMFITDILLIYDNPIYPNRYASTVMEHVRAFESYSRFSVQSVNTSLGFPSNLKELKFQIIILHYSLFGSLHYRLNNKFLEFIRNSKSYKIAFFQDEYYRCQQRFAFINRYKIDCIYTLLSPKYFGRVYAHYTDVQNIHQTLTGYVDRGLIEKANRFSKPDHFRNIDIGYRARKLPLFMGKGAQEKHLIADGFLLRSSNLKLDIDTRENKRKYGDNYYRFLGNCKGCLGVESGTSIFDVTDTVESLNPSELAIYEDMIPYRTISPRHFEAAAFRVCQILFEGDYQGILKPMVHYIPLKKDFSNMEEVLILFKNDSFRSQITNRCYEDLIGSGKYSYQGFVRDFDGKLANIGYLPKSEISKGKIKYSISTLIHSYLFSLIFYLYKYLFFMHPFVKLYRNFKVVDKKLEDMVIKDIGLYNK